MTGKNIYLTGMMGSGKSVTGKRLAARLGYGFVDLDDKIQERTKKTIVEIFASHGEAFFRAEESQALKETAAQQSLVVATGGGTIINPANIEQMRQSGKVVFLETSLDMLWNRVKDKRERPLLNSENPREKLGKIFEERKPVYEKSCDWKVNTDGKTASSVADEIYEWLKSKGNL